MGLFRRRKPEPEPEPAAETSFGLVTGRQYSVALAYLARAGDAVRLAPGPDVLASLPRIVEPLTLDGVEVVAPLPLELASAAPAIERISELEQWILARRQASPVTRHALHVLEMTEAIDMTIDTLICGLLHGETDTTGYPTYDAISGGLASHFDDLTGELIVRAVVGWGGKGQRGDTERIGTRLLSNLQQQVLVSGLRVSSAEAPVRGQAGEGRVCGHCGFDSTGTGAFYCPKCGMRLGGTA
ncbi:MAG TPA: hypothetical protein VFP83_07455 [Candidatus Limnocylindria bacterium]|nr:hypothetical protein [Candidatus Limnocylindria bacterium]